MTLATPSKRRRLTALPLPCLLLALLAGAPARAQDAAAVGGDTPHRFGLLLDAGAPHGVGLSAVARPLPWLRLQAGPTTNTLSVGVRGGVSLLPFQTFVAPSLNAEVGHYFGSDYREVLNWLGAAAPSGSGADAIRDVTYDYVSASLGLEVGTSSRFNFYLHLGLSHVALGVDDATAILQDATDDPSISARGLSLRATIPSVKLGFILYLF